MRSKTACSLLPDIARLGVERRPVPAGRLLPYVNDLELEEGEQLEGQQSYADTNKIIPPTSSRFPEFPHHQIHMVALA
jgi:hypothetical protein